MWTPGRLSFMAQLMGILTNKQTKQLKRYYYMKSLDYHSVKRSGFIESVKVFICPQAFLCFIVLQLYIISRVIRLLWHWQQKEEVNMKINLCRLNWIKPEYKTQKILSLSSFQVRFKLSSVSLLTFGQVSGGLGERTAIFKFSTGLRSGFWLFHSQDVIVVKLWLHVWLLSCGSSLADFPAVMLPSTFSGMLLRSIPTAWRYHAVWGITPNIRV